MAYIEINGKKSSDLGLILINDMEHVPAVNDIEPLEIKGRDGVLLVDNNRLKSVEQTFPFVVKPNNSVAETAQEISDWLNFKGFQTFRKSWEPSYIYKAVFLETFELSEIVRTFGKVNLTFMFHPIKYLEDGQKERTISNGQTVVNRGNVPANPLIKISGNGDINLTINGRTTKLKNVERSLIWNTERKLVYKGDYTSQWQKVVASAGHYEKPYLDVGNNTVSWSGSATVSLVTNEGVKI